ncbi:polysaccharide biosynthesis/export family protein [Poseidonibacter antarcticus]|uniref:polysaccharide biosynthesis/export family protein n=1 Tax=Poseidonibacter antarcticus TaxID=2478538 RepID=UPI000EF5335D|nr:polysaccharide biosynthesis/export family protein [Poseidonibacter antarcticus]
MVVLKNVVFLSILILLTGCGSKNYKLFQQQEESSSAQTTVSKAQYQKDVNFESVISKNDRVNITVYVQSGKDSQQMTPILSGDMINSSAKVETKGLLVSKKGSVILPLVGEVKISGLTQHEATALLLKKYKKYIRNPYVLIEIQNQRIIVLGEVKKPGIVPIVNGNMNIIEVLARSGDFTDVASRDDILVVRGDLRNPKIMQINLTSLDAIKQTSLVLKPNDIVYVQPSSLKGINVAIKEGLPILQVITNLLLSYSIVTDD